jgi:hypothetical protein
VTPGAVLYLTEAASPHFTNHPILLRVDTVQDWVGVDGWVWIAGVEVDTAGVDLVPRCVYVHTAGVAVVAETANLRRRGS